MANLSLTNIEVVSGASSVEITLGEAGSECELVRLLAADGKYYLAECDGGVEDAEVTHILVNDAAAQGKAVAIPLTSTSTILKVTGDTITVGEVYFLSATAGAIAPQGDLVAGNKLTKIGIGISSNEIQCLVEATGKDHP